MRKKNKGITFEDYERLVNAELIIMGHLLDDVNGYPDEEEIRKDWENDLTPLECAKDFHNKWLEAEKRKREESIISEEDTDILDIEEDIDVVHPDNTENNDTI